jgi:hypothetical protein
MKNQDEFRLWFYTKDVRNPDLGINLSKYDVDEIVHVFVEEKKDIEPLLDMTLIKKLRFYICLILSFSRDLKMKSYI